MTTPELTLHAKVLKVDSIGLSRNGNPSYFVTIELDDGSVAQYRTETDGSIGYAITNYRPSHGRYSIGTFTIRGKRERITFFKEDE